MSVVFWVMVLIVKGRIAGRSVHHAGLSVHHVAHRRIRTVCPAWSCGQWWKHYTLLRLDLCSVIGRRVLDKLTVTPSKVLEELETSMPTRYDAQSPHLKEVGWGRSRGIRITKGEHDELCDAIHQSHDHISDNFRNLYRKLRMFSVFSENSFTPYFRILKKEEKEQTCLF